MNALLHAMSEGFRAARDAWRSTRGNPDIVYRFKAGDRVRVSGPEHEDFHAVVVRREYRDESYRLDNGWTVQGHRLAHLKAAPPWRISGKE